MSSPIEHLLPRFVDRESELRCFCRMLDEPDWPRPIMMVWGDEGMGKSSLLLRMMHECSLRSLVKAEVIWSETRHTDYLGIMRKIRDDIGAVRFGEFTRLVNHYTDPQWRQPIKVEVEVKGQISVAENLSLGAGAQVGTVAGVVFRDAYIEAPRTDLAIEEKDRMARLTDQFIQELNVAAAERKIVVFLQPFEKATESTRRWVWAELLGALRERRLANVHFVIAGCNQPAIEDRWRLLVEERQLAPFTPQHVQEFLIKHKVDPQQAAAAAILVHAATGGKPMRLAQAVATTLSNKEEEARPR